MSTLFNYREYYTTPLLSGSIRKFWVLDNLVNSAPVLNKNVLPNGCFNLAFVAGQGVIIQNRRGRQEMPQARYFCGQAYRSVDVLIQPFTHVTMVQLQPWALSALTTHSLARTVDSIMPLMDILPEVDHLFEQHQTEFSKTPCIEHAIMAWVDVYWPNVCTHAPCSFLQQACLRIMEAKGCLGVDELAQKMACSTRLLEKQFKRYLGLSPKAFTTVLRVRGVVDTFRNKQAQQSLTQVAVDYGFYDQAHFIHTFKKMVLRSPGQFNHTDYLLPLTGTGY